MNARTKRIRDAKPRGHYYLGDLATQLAGISRQAGAINGKAHVAHIAAKNPAEFVAPIDTGKAAAACQKRIAKFYGLNNKYCKANGWTKRPDQR